MRRLTATGNVNSNEPTSEVTDEPTSSSESSSGAGDVEYCCRSSDGVLRHCKFELWWHLDPLPANVTDAVGTLGTDVVEHFDVVDSDRSGDISFSEFHRNFFDFSLPNATFEFWARLNNDMTMENSPDWTNIKDRRVTRDQWPALYSLIGPMPSPRFIYPGDASLMLEAFTPQYAVKLTAAQASPGWVDAGVWSGDGIAANQPHEYVLKWPKLPTPVLSGGGSNCVFDEAGIVSLTVDEAGAQIMYSLALVQSGATTGTFVEYNSTAGIPIKWHDSCIGACTYAIRSYAVKDGYTDSSTMIKQCSFNQGSAAAVAFNLRSARWSTDFTSLEWDTSAIPITGMAWSSLSISSALQLDENGGSIVELSLINSGQPIEYTVEEGEAVLPQCTSLPGACANKLGIEQQDGVIKLLNGDFSTEAEQRRCLQTCQALEGATGCQVVWNSGQRGCYAHTATVDSHTQSSRHVCWIFSECTEPAPVDANAGWTPYTAPLVFDSSNSYRVTARSLAADGLMASAATDTKVLLHWAQAPPAHVFSVDDWMLPQEVRKFDFTHLKPNGTSNFVITNDVRQWQDVVVLDEFGSSVKMANRDGFNTLFAACPVVQYVRNGAVMAVYVRTSSIPSDFDAYSYFTSEWRIEQNEIGHDFELYDSLDDIGQADRAWQFCNYNDPDVGFPRECGKDGSVPNRWFSMPGGKYDSRGVDENGLRFQIFTGSQCPVDPLVLGQTASLLVTGSETYGYAGCTNIPNVNPNTVNSDLVLTAAQYIEGYDSAASASAASSTTQSIQEAPVYTLCEEAARQSGDMFAISNNNCWLLNSVSAAIPDSDCEAFRDEAGHRLGGYAGAAVYQQTSGVVTSSDLDLSGQYSLQAKLIPGNYRVHVVTSMPYMRDSGVFSLDLNVAWMGLPVPYISCSMFHVPWDNSTCGRGPVELGATIMVSHGLQTGALYSGQPWVAVTNIPRKLDPNYPLVTIVSTFGSNCRLDDTLAITCAYYSASVTTSASALPGAVFTVGDAGDNKVTLSIDGQYCQSSDTSAVVECASSTVTDRGIFGVVNSGSGFVSLETSSGRLRYSDVTGQVVESSWVSESTMTDDQLSSHLFYVDCAEAESSCTGYRVNIRPTTPYSSPIDLGQMGAYMITAASYSHGYIPSPSISVEVDVVQAVVPPPSFVPVTKNHFQPVQVSLNVSSSGATVYYTTDGSEPDTTSSVYSGPLTFDASTTLSAFASVNDARYKPSTVVTVRYEVLTPQVDTIGVQLAVGSRSITSRGPTSGGNTVRLSLKDTPHWTSWLTGGSSDLIANFGPNSATAIQIVDRECNDNFCNRITMNVLAPGASIGTVPVEVSIKLLNGQTYTTSSSGIQYTYDALAPTAVLVEPSKGSVEGGVSVRVMVRYLLSTDSGVITDTDAVLSAGQALETAVVARMTGHNMTQRQHALAEAEQASYGTSLVLLRSQFEAQWGSDPTWYEAEESSFSKDGTLEYHGLQDTFETQLFLYVPAEANWLADNNNGSPGMIDVSIRMKGTAETLCQFNYTYTADTTPRITGLTPAAVSAIGAEAPAGSSQEVMDRYAAIGSIVIETAYVDLAVGTTLSAFYAGVSTTATVLTNTHIKSQTLQLPTTYLDWGSANFASITLQYNSQVLDHDVWVEPAPSLKSILCGTTTCQGVTGKSLDMIITLENVPPGFIGDVTQTYLSCKFGSQQTSGTVNSFDRTGVLTRVGVRSPVFTIDGSVAVQVSFHNDNR
jgi:hypothetical protein